LVRKASRLRRGVPFKRHPIPGGLSLVDHALYGLQGRLVVRQNRPDIEAKLADLNRRALTHKVPYAERQAMLRQYARAATRRIRTGFQNKQIAQALENLKVVPSPADYEYIGESP